MKNVKILGFEIPAWPYLTAAEHERLDIMIAEPSSKSSTRVDLDTLSIFVETRLGEVFDVDAFMADGGEFNRAELSEGLEVLARPFFEAQANMLRREATRRLELSMDPAHLKKQLEAHQETVKRLKLALTKLRNTGGGRKPN